MSTFSRSVAPVCLRLPRDCPGPKLFASAERAFAYAGPVGFHPDSNADLVAVQR